ncbi:MAG: TonB-dependent siderophore receptor [SAR86 cluster bacterium]|uniref:TonB-dependent siderophore receptor n=1 Tax=SAR86 cluster bacterium TaxID=2030880 RepID=A0A2A5AI64_9GAMM|nr:MAG: TonB-dependent siderophore receptor [SAR86 cluster bacterium]
MQESIHHLIEPKLGSKPLNIKSCARNRLAQAISLIVLSTASMTVAAQVELQTTTVGANTEEGYRIDRAQSFKYSQPLIETPKTLTIISASVMRDRGVDNLRDALRSVPGISMAAGEGGTPTGDSMTIRGFSARTDIFADGIRDIAGYSRDTYNTEGVEISKGPGSSVSGRGSVGGSVNLVKKTARSDRFTSVGYDSGSENDYRFTLDTNFRVGETSAFRINLLSTDGEVAGRDKVENAMQAIAVNFATGLDTASRFSFTAEFQDQDRLPDYGLPWVPVGLPGYESYALAPPPTSLFDNFYGNVHRDFENIRATTLTARYERDLTPNSTLRFQARQATVDRHSLTTAPRFVSSGGVYPDPILIRWDDEKPRDQENNMTVLQAAYTTAFDTANIGHELSIGAEYYDEEEIRWSETPNGTDNLVNGLPNDFLNPQPTLAYTGSYTRTGAAPNTGAGETRAIYVFDTLTLSERWEINAGGRWESYKNKTVSGSNTLHSDDSMLSWNAAAVYKLQDNATIYFGVGKSFNPAAEDLTANTRDNETDLDPEESLGFELGTKWELFDNRLLAGAALFHTVKTNARTDDPFDGGTAVTPGTNTSANTLDGEQTVNGLELSAFGQITDKLSIAAGYTYQKGEITKANGADAYLEGLELPRTPEYSLSLWLSYSMSDTLSMGIGSEYVDDRTNGTSSRGIRVAPSYQVFDAMVSWQATDQLSLQFNGSNLGDERYADLVGGGHFVPGPGRYFSLSAHYAF